MTKFSILIPTHNRLELLSYAINTVQKQSYANWEIIVSDNASTENIEGYVKRLSDPRIKYVRSDRFLPVTENWNNSLNHADGDYFIMLGDDDGLLPGSLEHLNLSIRQHQSPDYIYMAGFQYAYPDVFPNDPRPFIQWPYFFFKPGTDTEYILNRSKAVAMVKQSMNFYLPFVYNMQHSVFSKKMLEKIREKGNFFQSPYPDYYATNVLFLVSEKTLVITKPLVVIGISPKSFGYYYFNQMESTGVEILNNKIQDLQLGRIKRYLLPGSEMNSSWLAAMELVYQNFGRQCFLKINYNRYRQIQIFSTYQEKGLSGVKAFFTYLTLFEKIKITFFDFFFKHIQTSGWFFCDQKNWQSWLRNLWFPYPTSNNERTTVKSLNILEIYHSEERPSANSHYLSFDVSSFGKKLFKLFQNNSPFSKQFFKLNLWLKEPFDWSQVDGKNIYIYFLVRNFKLQKIVCRLLSKTSGAIYEGKIINKLFFSKIAYFENIPAGPYFIEILRNESIIHKSGINVTTSESMLLRQNKYNSLLSTTQKTTHDSVYEITDGSVLFSLTTTVFNTPLNYFKELVSTVLSQSYSRFEWLVLDNGSTEPDLVKYLSNLSKIDHRIKFFRVNNNIHIIPGNRFLFEKAKGDYLVPIDSDDIIYPRALEEFHIKINQNPNSSILFSDEQTIDAQSLPLGPIPRKPSLSWIDLYSTCPFSHLSAIRLDLARSQDLYSDTYAQGSHDWDSALRIAECSPQFVHIPSILYGWRVHEQSSAFSISTKPYALMSQEQNIAASLQRRDLIKNFKIQSPVQGYYHLNRLPFNGPKVQIHFLVHDNNNIENLYTNLKMTRYDNSDVYIHFFDSSIDSKNVIHEIKQFILTRDLHFYANQTHQALCEILKKNAIHAAIVDCQNAIKTSYWVWGGIGSFEIDPSIDLVGGKILNPKEEVLHIGYYRDLSDSIDTPGYLQSQQDIKAGAAYIRSSVHAVHSSFCVLHERLIKNRLFPTYFGGSATVSSIQWAQNLIFHNHKICFTPDMVAICNTLNSPSIESQTMDLSCFSTKLYNPLFDTNPQKYNCFRGLE